MYLEEEEKTSFQKLIIALNTGCATIFSVCGKVIRGIAHFLAGDANQNGRHKEVNS